MAVKGVSMLIEDSFTVAAPLEEVWAVLSDPIALAECFPGVEEVQRLDELRTTALLRVKIGYISAAFGVDGEIVEVQAPYLIRSRLQGRDKKLGSMVIGETCLRLTPSVGGTVVHYAGDISITGHVASLGRSFIERKAKQDLAQFASKVQERLCGRPTMARNS